MILRYIAVNKTTPASLCSYDQLPGCVLIYRYGERREILYANNSACRLFGCFSEEDLSYLAKQDYRNLINDEDTYSLNEVLRITEELELGEEFHIHYRVRKKNGERILIDDHGRLTFVPELRKIVISFLEESEINYDLWNALMNSQTINMFWKDEHRRFVGVNRQFLDTYGFSDLSEVLGKTDEDMHWHINDEPYKKAEEEILRTGAISRNKRGKNIIRGIAHNIIATKEPVYRDGKIIGLFGYFINIDNFLAEIGNQEARNLIDPITGLMSSHGVHDILSDYVEGWEQRSENFALIQIVVPEYAKALKTRGEPAARAVLTEIAKILVEETHHQAACARMFAGNFLMFAKFTNKQDIKNLQKHIEARLNQVRSMSPSARPMRTQITIHYASDVTNIRDLVGFAQSDDD